MRRFVQVLLLFLALILFTGCVARPTEQVPTTTAPEPLVPSPMTWEKINSLPIADSSMSEQELRQLCTDFFRMQQTFQWTPAVDLNYDIPTYDKHPVLTSGTVYAGIPYISPSKSGNLYIAMHFYDPQTGVIDPGEKRIQTFLEQFGNDCTSGSYWGWARVVNSTTGFSNAKMNAIHGYLPVGEYNYPSWTSWGNENTTRAVCQSNGEQTMYEAYAQLKMADGLFMHLDRSANSHMLMVAQDAVVVRTADGHIDGENSYIIYLDQGSTLEATTAEDGTPMQIQGGVDETATFKYLYDKGYIGFTFAELIGQNPVEKGEASCALAGKESITLTELISCSAHANYAISHTTATISDENGTVKHQSHRYSGRPNEMNLPVLGSGIYMNQLTNDLAETDLNITITCFISTGEEITVYTGRLTK